MFNFWENSSQSDLEDRGLCIHSTKVPFIYGQPDESIKTSVTREDIQHSMDQAAALLNDGYNLLRQKATEIMVWVLTNKDRNSKLEIPCSVPIAFGLKDYRLTSNAMRKATEKVLSECRKRNIRVDSLSADGQWIQLMLRDQDGNPSTVYQLQRDVWRDVKKLSKQDIVKKISVLNRVDINEPDIQKRGISIEKEPENGCLVVVSKGEAFSRVRTTQLKYCWEKKTKAKSASTDETDIVEDDIALQTQRLKEIDWIPAEILQEISEGKNDELVRAITLVEETRSVLALDRQEQTSDEVIANDDATYERNEGQNESQQPTTTAQERDTQQPQRIEHLLDKESVDKMLQSLLLCGKRWQCVNDDELKEILLSEEKLFCLTHSEINAVYDVIKDIKSADESKPLQMRKSWNKQKKTAYLCELFGNPVNAEAMYLPRRRTVSVPTLSSLVTKVLRGRKIPKDVLAVAYSQYIFPEKTKEWLDASSIRDGLTLDGFEDRFHSGTHSLNIASRQSLFW